MPEKQEQNQIPTSKIQRAGRFVKTGWKVGGNYAKHYAKKIVKPDLDREELDKANAEDIYESLSELKGSALKVAQMLSMDKGVLPTAYTDQFSLAQHKAPPLSGPLIVKTFKRYFGQAPSELFDEFEMEAAHAASIGQVHRAWINGEPLAVKIQYPGVADSVISDLNIVRPVARRIFGWKDRDIETYFEEVKARLVEETDYALEVERSMAISQQCAHIPNLVFATYHPELSCDRVISMSWLEGTHLDDFLAKNPSQAVRNSIGQALWDFYNFQVHQLKMMHADAHPGNFLFREDGTVGILDFGCVKEIPAQFYESYFRLLNPDILQDEAAFLESCRTAQMIMPDDTPEQVEFFTSIFREALNMVTRPFHSEHFDFGDEDFFAEIYAFGDRMGGDAAIRKTMRKAGPRGDKDGIYMNRAYFGLFSILNKLQAQVETKRYMPSFV
jgi:predicted unusual protein kinase regulating ubiquinone biosynthesis (AarF/ABC1/UbiB family)